MKLTDKETKALTAIFHNALEGMGGKNIESLKNDNYSWFDVDDITRKTGFNKHEVAGLISSLGKKGIVNEEEQTDWNGKKWIKTGTLGFLTEEGLDVIENNKIEGR